MYRGLIYILYYIIKNRKKLFFNSVKKFQAKFDKILYQIKPAFYTSMPPYY